jgi:hypothetical protein
LVAGPGPDAKALRLLLLAELVSAAGFERDRLYIEWQLHYDPEQWILQHSEQEVVQPGLIQVGQLLGSVRRGCIASQQLPHEKNGIAH